MRKRISNNLLFSLILIIGITVVSACSYDSEKALNNGDVINMHGPIFNYSIFESFLDSVDSQKPDMVRITNFMLDGNPTFYNLNFDGSSIDLEIDKSKDKNRGKDSAKVKMTCTDLAVEDGQQLITYTLEGCDDDSSVESFTILSVAKNQWDDDEH
jgi:hypothetical protein